MPRPLKSRDIAGRRIVGIFRARLPGDPEDSEDHADYFRAFVALDNETYFQLFDDVSLENEPDLLYDKADAESLDLRTVEQVMAKDCRGKTVKGVSLRPNGETIVWLTEGQMIMVTADYDTEVCLIDVDKYRRDEPWFFEGLKTIGDS